MTDQSEQTADEIAGIRDRIEELGRSEPIIVSGSGKDVTVYVALRDEGVDVWRPVKSEAVGELVFRLADDPVPDGEHWQFPPGSLVRCELRDLERGTSLVAVSAA